MRFRLCRLGRSRRQAEGRLDHSFQARQTFAQLNLPISQRSNLIALRGDLGGEALIKLLDFRGQALVKSGYALPDLMSLSQDQTRQRNGHGEDGNDFRTHGATVYVANMEPCPMRHEPEGGA